MEYVHHAIDGSVVTVSTEAQVRPGPVTNSGWAVSPTLMRSHPFTAYPAGHSHTMERAVRENFPDVRFLSEEEVSLKGGTLRVGAVEVPRRGGPQRLTVGAWEAEHGCLTTSLTDERETALIEVFDTLRFHDGERGVVIDSPVMSRPRAPELAQDVAGLGVMTVRPAIATELERVPRDAGRRTRSGEVWRSRAESRALLFVGRTSVVRIQPGDEIADDEVADAVETLEVEWAPRMTRRVDR